MRYVRRFVFATVHNARFGPTKDTREQTMNREESIQVDTLEIADLEYDVGGMGAEEPAESRNLPGYIIVMVAPPK